MRTIYKYKLEATDEQTIAMPYGAQILSVQVQADIPCIWAMVDTDEETMNYKTIYTYGTGHKLPHDMDQLKYIGTYQLYGGDLVFHVFELI